MSRPSEHSAMLGPGLAVVAYALLSLQDASVKILVATHPVWQMLLLRSLFVVAISLAVGARSGLLRRTARAQRMPGLIWRGLLILAAWSCYYTASRDLELAQMTTIYFAAPLIVTGLSVALLRESVPLRLWLSTGLGFVGVIVACSPGEIGSLLPVVLVLAAAVFWALNAILIRSISAYVESDVQMLVANVAFIAFCAPLMFWMWAPLSWRDLFWMAGVACISACSQYALLESYRLAPASIIAPFEYTLLVCSFILSYLIWGVVPTLPVWIGAGMICAAGLLTILFQVGLARARAAAGGPAKQGQ